MRFSFEINWQLENWNSPLSSRENHFSSTVCVFSGSGTLWSLRSLWSPSAPITESPPSICQHSLSLQCNLKKRVVLATITKMQVLQQNTETPVSSWQKTAANLKVGKESWLVLPFIVVMVQYRVFKIPIFT